LICKPTFNYRLSFSEHSLHLPLHLEYRLLFSKDFSLYAETGISFDCGLSAQLSASGDESGESIDVYGNEEYGFYNEQFVPYWDYGFGVCIKNVQLGFSGSRGLSDYKGDGFKVQQNKSPMLSFAWMLF
jgi:hypothetical protein